MPADDSLLSKRHALKVALVYLLIRCLPELLFYVISVLPDDTVQALAKTYGAWLRHVYPVVPLQVLNVPLGFQHTLALLPVLIIEVLFVFLFSAWFLQRRPWAAQTNLNNSRWIVLIVATLIWSFVIRLQILGYFQLTWIDQLQALQAQDDFYDRLPRFMMKANWSINAMLYATTPLWALVPTWLHFRFTRKPAAIEAPPNTSTDNTHDTSKQALPLQRAVVFASFLLGSLAIHFMLVMATYLGLWPWAAELSKTNVPMEMLNELSLPLSLGQIVLSSLICALAAAVYTRRLTVARTSIFPWVIKPLMCGAVAYLLTSFLILALAWLFIWINPTFADDFARHLSRDPQGGLTYAISLGVLAMVLLCIMSGRLRQSPRRWTGVLALLMLCVSVPLYVGWTLAGSNMGTAGRQPGLAITGKLGDAHWRNMEQWCTGVVETRHGTWLVGRDEVSSRSNDYVPEGVPDLSTLLASNDETATQHGRGLFGSSRDLTTLSLLQDDGTFKMVATVPDVACFIASPTSETLFLLTGIDRPPSQSSALFTREQTAIFRSVDHGTTWEWVKSGFMPDVESLAWSVAPTFSSDKEVWAWGKEPASDDEPAGIWGRPEPAPERRDANGNLIKPTALFYSPDQGQTSNVIFSPQPLVAPISYLREITGQPNGDFSSRRDMDQERFVVQIDQTRAYAWVSEFLWYHVGEDDSRRLTLTTRAELSRPDASSEWQVTNVIRQPNLHIEQLSTSQDGRTYAVLADKDGEWLAKLDTKTGDWIERNRTPSVLPGWLVEDRTSARYFWNNGDYQVISQWGDTVVPRLLIPFLKERAEIDTDAHFYTRDGGRTWHQLAIPGYLGVMGLSPRGSKLYWNRGNWYSDNEPLQWEYDLAK